MLAYLGLTALVAVCALLAMGWTRREWTGLAVVGLASAGLALVSDRGPGVWALLALDLAGVLLLGRLAWKAPRLWPIWVAAALGVGAAASLAYLLQPDVDAQTYGRAMLLTRYAAALALLVGLRRKQASHS